MADEFRVRWRPGGGRTTPQASATFETAEDAIRARELIKNARSNIDKPTLVALVLNQPLPEPDEPEAEIVRALIEPYLRSKHTVTPGWLDRTRRILTFALLPTVGDMPITAVKPRHIDDILAWLLACDCDHGVPGIVCSRARRRPNDGHTGGYARRTVDLFYTVMGSFFNWAVKHELRGTNPVFLVNYKPLGLAKYNAGIKEDRHFYMTPAQFRLLRDRFDPRYRVLLEFLVQTGARFGEATALTVKNVLTDAVPHPKISIAEAWKKGDSGEPFYVGVPKSGSKRVIAIRQELLDLMRPLLDGKGPNDLVFTAPRGGRLLSSNFWHEFWEPGVRQAMICPSHPVPNRGQQIAASELSGPTCGENGGTSKRQDKCGSLVLPGWDRCAKHIGPDPAATSTCECWDKRLPKVPVPHDLRHSHAAKLIRDRIPLKAISVRLGHSSVVITETVYAGLLEEINDDIVIASSMDGD